MARPDIIESLHSAWYDCLWQGNGCQETKDRYEEIRGECCRKFDCSPDELAQVVRDDFGKWMKENDLPRPPRHPKGER